MRKLPELALDEAGEGPAVGSGGGLLQEGLQVLADDAMEDRARRIAGLIGGRAHARAASDACAASGAAVPPWTGWPTATRI